MFVLRGSQVTMMINVLRGSHAEVRVMMMEMLIKRKLDRSTGEDLMVSCM